jgi:polyferredoxin
MHKKNPLVAFGLWALLIVAVVALSLFFNGLWGPKAESITEPDQWVIDPQMTLAQFGQANSLPNPVLKEIFGLTTSADLQKPLADYGAAEQVQSLVRKKLALAAEHASKNWLQILIKFVLWFAFLSFIFFFYKNRKVGAAARKWFLLAAVMIFGVIMGADPSPMGTVKDAIHLLGASGVLFPPRLIALAVFLLIVFAVNKFICGWGCQIGTLQDLVFRLNQDERFKPIIGRQYKPAFAVTNTIRILFLIIFTLAAFAWGMDIIEPIDPFKIYKPLTMGVAGVAVMGVLLISGLFVYRPWCHFFCPFGLVGWVVEKISRVKISVNYDTCIACEKCAQACPSNVMGAILKRDKKTIPDCFSCRTCTDVCPTGSVALSTRKRTLPPLDHFRRNKE